MKIFQIYNYIITESRTLEIIKTIKTELDYKILGTDQAVLTQQLAERESELINTTERNFRSTVGENRDLTDRIRDMSDNARRREE